MDNRSKKCNDFLVRPLTQWSDYSSDTLRSRSRCHSTSSSGILSTNEFRVELIVIDLFSSIEDRQGKPLAPGIFLLSTQLRSLLLRSL